MEHEMATIEDVPFLFDFWAKALYCTNNGERKNDINDTLIFPTTEAIETATRHKLVHGMVDEYGLTGAVFGFTASLKYDDRRYGNLVDDVSRLVGDASFIIPVFVVNPLCENKRIVCEELMFALYASASDFRQYFSVLVLPTSKNNPALQNLYRTVFCLELVDTIAVRSHNGGHRNVSFYLEYID